MRSSKKWVTVLIFLLVLTLLVPVPVFADDDDDDDDDDRKRPNKFKILQNQVDGLQTQIDAIELISTVGDVEVEQRVLKSCGIRRT